MKPWHKNQAGIRMPGVRGLVIGAILPTAYALHLPAGMMMARLAWLNVSRPYVTGFR